MKIYNYFQLVACFFILTSVHGQLKVDAELRPRFEYRHGFKTLFPDNTDAAAFISQRTRLNTAYSADKLDFYLSIQDIRVWGDVSQLNSADANGLGIHQAWGQIHFTPDCSIKLGRQVLAYDDQRIFGGVGWAQQARSHDAALLKYHKERFALDVGFAFNQNGEALTGTTLTVPNTYKSMQFAWLHNDWNNLKASFLLLNNGVQFIDANNNLNNETRYSQTIGTHLKYKADKLGIASNLYYQFGNDKGDNDLSAYLLSLEADYSISPKWKASLGGELLSGNDNGGPSNGTNNAFTPFYGTNHKFNGLMDYFYVGNHANNVGLVDLYLGSVFKLSAKSSLNARFHSFSAAADIASTNSKKLGEELDLVFNYNFSKDINIKAGYSVLFASEGMEVLKNNTDDNGNYWGWAMVTIKPSLFTSKKED